MALRSVDLQIAHVFFRGHQCIHQFPRAGWRETPVGGERHHAKTRLGPGKGLGQVVVEVGCRVEVVQRLGHQQVSVGVETPGKLFALITQVALDLKLDAVEVVVEVFVLQATAEFLTHRVIGQVRDMPDHARQHQAALGDHAFFLERTAVELGVGEDGLTGDFVERDILRGQFGCRGNCQAMAQAIRVADAPLQRLHAAQAATDHCGPLVDTQPVSQACLAMDPIFNGQYRELGAKRAAGIGIDAARACRAVAAAQVVQADDEELVGIDGLAGTYATVPPAGLAFIGAVIARRVMVP